MKGYSEFPKALALLEHHDQIVQCHIQDTRWGGPYPSAEKQFVYSTAPAVNVYPKIVVDIKLKAMKLNTRCIQ